MNSSYRSVVFLLLALLTGAMPWRVEAGPPRRAGIRPQAGPELALTVQAFVAGQARAFVNTAETLEIRVNVELRDPPAMAVVTDQLVRIPAPAGTTFSSATADVMGVTLTQVGNAFEFRSGTGFGRVSLFLRVASTADFPAGGNLSFDIHGSITLNPGGTLIDDETLDVEVRFPPDLTYEALTAVANTTHPFEEYRYRITTTARAGAAALQVQANIPDGVDLVPGSITGGGVVQGNLIGWDLADSRQATLEFGVKVKSPAALGTLTRIISACSARTGADVRGAASILNIDFDFVNLDMTAETPIAGRVQPGQEITYTLTATPARATLMEIDALIPAGTTLTDSTPPATQPQPNQLQWLFPSSGQQVVRFRVRVNDADELPDDLQQINCFAQAAVVLGGSLKLDPATVDIPLVRVDLEVEHDAFTVDPGRVRPGESVRYRITITLPQNADSLTIDNPVPEGAQKPQVLSGPGTVVGNSLRWSFTDVSGPLVVEFSAKVKSKKKLPRTQQEIRNSAAIRATLADGSPTGLDSSVILRITRDVKLVVSTNSDDPSVDPLDSPLTKRGLRSLRSVLEFIAANPEDDYDVTFDYREVVGKENSIRLRSALPDIETVVRIDGADRGSGRVVIKRDPSLLHAEFDGVVVRSTRCLLKDLTIVAVRNGIVLEGGGGHTIQGCMVGTTGNASLQPQTENLFDGLLLVDSANNLIGGAKRLANIFAGNLQGIVISGAGSTGNRVVNNQIGFFDRRRRQGPIGNRRDGVVIEAGAVRNSIGELPSRQDRNAGGNDIHFNAQVGVLVTGANENRIVNNLLLGNRVGVVLDQAGRSLVQANNVDSNKEGGLEILGRTTPELASENVIRNNRFVRNGADDDTTHPGAVHLVNARANQIGTPKAPGDDGANLISDNAGHGVVLEGFGSALNRVQNNDIGIDTLDPRSARGNEQGGVLLVDGARLNFIGAEDDSPAQGGAANRVVLNDGEGVALGVGVENNQIRRNFIEQNRRAGIALFPGAGLGNTLSGNLLQRNGDLEIDLLNDGPSRTGETFEPLLPNGLLAPPEITGKTGSAVGVTLTISFRIPRPGRYRMEVYGARQCTPNNFRKRPKFVAVIELDFDQAGTFPDREFTINTLGLQADAGYSAALTDFEGNTSEFGACF